MKNPNQQNKALKLLKEYRPALWRKSTLEAVPRTNSLSLTACLEQIQLTQALVESLKNDIRLGEKMFWIIRATFMTDKQPGDIDDILNDIAVKYEHVPRRTYFRLKKQALERLNERIETIAR